MAKIVDLKEYRTRQAELKSYAAWEKRFGGPFTAGTRPSDLSDRVVHYLATPGDGSNTAFYELIMGTLGLGTASGFFHLGNEEQLRVVDIHLFLADQVRFEMLRRMGWIAGMPWGNVSLIEWIKDFDRLKLAWRGHPPELTSAHPDYDAFKDLSPREKEVFVRQMLRRALDLFAERLRP